MANYNLVEALRSERHPDPEYGSCARCGARAIMADRAITASGLMCLDCLLLGSDTKRAEQPIRGRLEEALEEEKKAQRQLSALRREIAWLKAQLCADTTYST